MYRCRTHNNKINNIGRFAYTDEGRFGSIKKKNNKNNIIIILALMAHKVLRWYLSITKKRKRFYHHDKRDNVRKCDIKRTI